MRTVWCFICPSQVRVCSHPGVVCAIGRVLDEEVRSDVERDGLTLERFMQLRRNGSLLEGIYECHTVRKAVGRVRGVAHVHARQLMRCGFLPAFPSGVPGTTTDPDMRLLVDEGLVVPGDEPGYFCVPSPALHDALVIQLATLDSLPCPSEHAFNADGTLLAGVDVVRFATKCLCPDTVRASIRWCSKSGRVPGLSDGHSHYPQVPREILYHDELARVLKAWFPMDVRIIPETCLEEATIDRCDLTVIAGGAGCLTVELAASVSMEEASHGVFEHVSRAAVYGVNQRATEAVCLYYGIAGQSDLRFLTPAEEDALSMRVTLVIVLHDREWSHVTLYEKARYPAGEVVLGASKVGTVSV